MIISFRKYVDKFTCLVTVSIYLTLQFNRSGAVVFSVLFSRAVYREFESRSDQNKDCKIGICCYSTNHVTF
jgi:hypothetical protein